jgi:hypothetical protein
VTTMDEVPSLTSVIGIKIAARLASRSKRKASNRPRTWMQTTVRLILHVAGFACLTYAGFMWDNIAGMCAAGISCFALSWLTTSGSSTINDNPQSTVHNLR